MPLILPDVTASSRSYPRLTLEHLRSLDVETLANEIFRLQNSIAHLRRSNDELEAFVAGGTDGRDGAVDQRSAEMDEVDDDTKQELEGAITENEGVIASQTARIDLIRRALEEKTGVDASNPHYDLATNMPALPPPIAAATSARVPISGEFRSDQQAAAAAGRNRAGDGTSDATATMSRPVFPLTEPDDEQAGEEATGVMSATTLGRQQEGERQTRRVSQTESASRAPGARAQDRGGDEQSGEDGLFL